MVANLRVEEWHAVHQQLRSIARRRAELDAEEARCLRHAERIQLWRRLGYVHMGEYLERELGYGPHAGAERMRVARALGDLPQIEAALSEGELHYSAVRELTRIAIRETEAAWLAAARTRPPDARLRAGLDREVAMKLAIFGATGKTGSLLLEHALAAGHEVTALAREPAKLPARERLRIIRGAAASSDAIAEAVHGPARSSARWVAAAIR